MDNKTAKTNYFIIFHLLVMVVIMALFSQAISDKGTKVQQIISLIYYVFIVALPAFLFLSIALKQNPLGALRLNNQPLKGMALGVLVGAGALLIFYLFNRFALAGDKVNQISVFYLVGTVLVGVLEEIPFRGLMLPHFKKTIGFWKANILVSVLFASLHFVGLLLAGGAALLPMLLLFVVSLWLGYLLNKTNSLWVPIVVHAMYNLAVYVL